MASNQSTSLKVAAREPGGSRHARRLRREGNVLGILYGGGDDPVPFQVPARTLRQALAHSGAVIDLSIDDAKATPVVVKELVRHPVNGETVHLDLLRVRLDQKIEATVPLELTGTDEAPGVIDGGVLEHVTREVTIEALPNDIPESVTFDVSAMQIGDTVMLASVTPPANISLVDDPETVIATLVPPKLQLEAEDEIEEETEVVGEGEEGESGEAAGDESADAEASGDSDAE